MTRRSRTTARPSPWLVLVTLCLGFFMVLLDATAVNIAVASIAAELAATLDDLIWILNAYILVFVVLLITAGRLGDRYGHKRIFMVGLAIFTLASVGCGLAPSAELLIAARVVQGLGGALLTPQTIAVLAVVFPADRRGAAFGVWGAVAGVATVAGPTLGGALVTAFGWRSVFLANLAVGLGALVAAAIVIPDLRPDRRHRFDPLGTALVTIGLLLVTYGLIEGQSHGWQAAWGPVTIPAIIAGGVGILVLFGFLQYARREREPLVPASIFADRNFTLMNLTGLAVGFAMLGLSLPVVLYLQAALGLSAFHAGMIIAPMALMSILVAPVAGRLSDRDGGKYPLVAGVTLFAGGIGVVIASAAPDASGLRILPGLAIAGTGIALTFTPLQTIAMARIGPPTAGAASGLLNTGRQLGACIGSAAVGAMLQVQLAGRLRATAAEHAGELPPELRARAAGAVDDAATGTLRLGGAGSGRLGGAGSGTGGAAGGDAPAIVDEFVARVFIEGLTDAVRLALVLPVLALAAAIAACLLVRRTLPAAGQAGGHGAPTTGG